MISSTSPAISPSPSVSNDYPETNMHYAAAVEVAALPVPDISEGNIRLQFKRSCKQLKIRVARKALMERFVPLHLGPAAFPRPACLENVNELARTLHLPSLRITRKMQ